MKQAHVIYSGLVQGVGFRYTMQRFAAFYQLTGWVKNLKDGRVEAILEGNDKDITKVLQNIESHFNGSIKDKKVTYGKTKGEFKDFQIVFKMYN